MKQASGVFEVVVMRPRVGAAPADVVAWCQDVQAWVKQQPGFVARKLLFDDKAGAYVDMITWRSMEDAERASANAMQLPCMAELEKLVTMESMTMLHAREIALS